MANVPPPPPGFVLQSGSVPAPPPGFQLVQQEQDAKPAPKKEGGIGRFIGDTVDKTGTGVYRGIAAVLGLPADLRDVSNALMPQQQSNQAVKAADAIANLRMTSPLVRMAYDAVKAAPNSGQIRDFIFNDLGVPERTAETPLGKIAQGGVEGLTATMMTGGFSPLAKAVGIGAGVGSEAAGLAFPESKIARPIGALVGGGIPYGFSRLMPGANSIVRDAMRGAGPDDVASALETQAASRTVGSPVTGAEAFNSPELLRLQRTVERSGGNNPLTEMMKARPDTQSAAINDISRSISPAVPPRVAKQDLVTAAKDAKNAVEAARTNAASPFYKAAASEAMPATVLDDVFASIDDQLTKVGTESSIGKQLVSYKDKIRSALEQGSARVGPLDAIYKETRDAIGKTKFEPGALDKEVRGVLKPINSQLGNALSRGNQNIAMGRAVYQQETPAVKAVTDSAVGDLIPRGSARPTIKGQAQTLLSPENARPDTVTRALRELSRQDPDAVPQWISSYVDTTMDTAMKRLASGSVENAGGKFYTAIAGTPQAKANLRAAFNTLPNGSARWNAMENALKVFEAQSRRLPVGSATSENLATSARLAQGASPKVINWLDESFRNLRYGRNVGKLAEIFARTDSVDELIRISRLNPGSKEAADAVGRFVALETQALGNRD